MQRNAVTYPETHNIESTRAKKLEPCTLLVGMHCCAAAVKNSLAVPENIEHKVSIWSRNSTSRNIPKSTDILFILLHSATASVLHSFSPLPPFPLPLLSYLYILGRVGIWVVALPLSKYRNLVALSCCWLGLDKGPFSPIVCIFFTHCPCICSGTADLVSVRVQSSIQHVHYQPWKAFMHSDFFIACPGSS